jgi:hypothetical protein
LSSLIFVWIGDKLPNWAVISLNIAVHNSNCNIYLLTTNISCSVNPICNQILISSFYKKSNYQFINNNSTFRDGFWFKTTERFFILRDFVAKNKIQSFFHAELDNLVFDISDLPVLFNNIGRGLFIPKDSIDRCIASLLYINESKVLNDFCDYVIDNPKLLDNDMLLLGDFANNYHDVFYLPNESIFNFYNEIKYLKYTDLGGFFDAAAIGQFLFGIDPRNSRFPIYNKFVNENAKFDLNKCNFNISITSNFAKIENINLYNIHVHSKIFENLIEEKWLNRLIKRINQNKKTIITYNLPWKH